MSLLIATIMVLAPDAPASAAPAEKKVCRQQEATGSLFTKRICHTKVEWADIDAANARENERFDAARRVDGNAGGTPR